MEPGTNCFSTLCQIIWISDKNLHEARKVTGNKTEIDFIQKVLLNPILTQVYQGGVNQLRSLLTGGGYRKVFYLVFTLVASEPDLSKVQQQHLLETYKDVFML